MAELEREMGAPGFWDDQARAAAVSAQHAAAAGRLSAYRQLTEEVSSLAEMAELLREEQASGEPDTALLAELADGIAEARTAWVAWRRRACSRASTTAATPS